MPRVYATTVPSAQGGRDCRRPRHIETRVSVRLTMPNDDADASAACRHVGTSVDRWIVQLTRFLAGRVITYQAGPSATFRLCCSTLAESSPGHHLGSAACSPGVSQPLPSAL